MIKALTLLLVSVNGQHNIFMNEKIATDDTTLTSNTKTVYSTTTSNSAQSNTTKTASKSAKSVYRYPKFSHDTVLGVTDTTIYLSGKKSKKGVIFRPTTFRIPTVIEDESSAGTGYSNTTVHQNKEEYENKEEYSTNETKEEYNETLLSKSSIHSNLMKMASSLSDAFGDLLLSTSKQQAEQLRHEVWCDTKDDFKYEINLGLYELNTTSINEDESISNFEKGIVDSISSSLLQCNSSDIPDDLPRVVGVASRTEIMDQECASCIVLNATVSLYYNEDISSPVVQAKLYNMALEEYIAQTITPDYGATSTATSSPTYDSTNTTNAAATTSDAKIIGAEKNDTISTNRYISNASIILISLALAILLLVILQIVRRVKRRNTYVQADNKDIEKQPTKSYDEDEESSLVEIVQPKENTIFIHAPVTPPPEPIASPPSHNSILSSTQDILDDLATNDLYDSSSFNKKLKNNQNQPVFVNSSTILDDDSILSGFEDPFPKDSIIL